MEVLRNIGWKATLQGPEMSGAKLESVTMYLSFNWLVGSHITDQIHAMQDELRASSFDYESPHLLVDLKFLENLIKAYKHQDQYCTSPDYKFLHMVEHDLSHGMIDSVGGLIHLNGNHYAIFVINAATQSVLLGDPQHTPLPLEVRASFTWWLRQLLLEGEERMGVSGPLDSIQIAVDSLPVTAQHDSHSCSILSLNTLMHHYIPEKVLLTPSGDKNTIVLERMCLVLRSLTL